MTKLFYEDSWNSRASKYVVRYFDGVSTYPDGSPLFGVACFSNRKARDQFERKLMFEGYTVKTQWNPIEISPNVVEG